MEMLERQSEQIAQMKREGDAKLAAMQEKMHRPKTKAKNAEWMQHESLDLSWPADPRIM